MGQEDEKLLISRRTVLKSVGAMGAGLMLKDLVQAETGAAGEKAIPTFCAMCGPGLGCGIYAFVKNGRFTRVEGMRERR